MRAHPAPATVEEPEGGAAASHGRRWWPALGLLLALAAGLAARLVAWSTVMTERGVRVAFDTDAYYHLHQAERLLSGRDIWTEPALNWPFGQGVLWPPLWDALIAGTARLAFGGAPGREQVALVAVLLPVVAGLLTVAVGAALAGLLLGRRHAVGAACLLAVLPPAVLWSSVGAADQHAAEVLLWSATVLAFAAGMRASSPRALGSSAAALGIATALAFWNWQGAALNLALPLLFAAAAHVLLPGHAATRRAAAVIGFGLGLGAALLAASVALLGPPGALSRGELAGVTGLHVAMSAGAAATGAGLAIARRLRKGSGSPLRRIAEVAAAGIIPAALALGAIPALRAGALHGLSALTASNPWYPEIAEYRRLLFSCYYPLSGDLQLLVGTYGLTFVAAAFAIPALVARARSDEDGRATVLFLACLAVPLLVLALVRLRFAPYFTVPLALLTALGVEWIARLAQRRFAPAHPRAAIAVGAIVAAAVLAPTARGVLDGVTTQPEGDVAAMQWLRDQPGAPGREGVLATWDLGHLVLYFAGKPAVASPFGTDGSVQAMVDTARFDLATDPGEAKALLERRRIGWVALSAPLPNAVMDQAFAGAADRPPVITAACSVEAGRLAYPSPAYADGLAARLFYFDGRPGQGRRAPPIDGLRLVYESQGQRVKIFGVVPGAEVRVTGAPSGGEVTASVFLRTNQGRDAFWAASAIAGADGTAALRVPYATGVNGAVGAGPVLVRAGTASSSVHLSETDVATGATVAAAP